LKELRKHFNIRTVTPHGGKWNYDLEESPEWDDISRKCGVVSGNKIFSSRKIIYLSDCSDEFKEEKIITKIRL
jgi:hypothetical protein